MSKIDAYLPRRGVFLAAWMGGWGCLVVMISLVEDDSFFASCLLLPVIWPFVGFYTSTESLILAQDERWRRA